HDVVQVAREAAALGRAALRHLAVAEHGSEDVVEVVRDSARERSHRLQALRLAEPALALAQCFLGPLALGDVGRGSGPAHDLARLVALADGVEDVPAGLAANDVAHFHREALALSREQRLARGLPSREILGMHVDLRAVFLARGPGRSR